MDWDRSRLSVAEAETARNRWVRAAGWQTRTGNNVGACVTVDQARWPRSAEFQRFWGPFEGHLRRVAPGSFDRLFAGICILELTHKAVVLGVPREAIKEYGDAEALAEALAWEMDRSGTGLRRGRQVRLVVMED